MATTSIIVNAVDTNGNTAQKSFTAVNPEATSAQLVQLGRLAASISGDTYRGTYRIDKINCDTEDTTSKTTRTLTLSRNSTTVAALIAGSPEADCTITFTGDGTPYAYKENLSRGAKNWGVSVAQSISNQNYYLSVVFGSDNNLDAGTVKICLPETETYKAATVTFTITE